MNNIYMNNIYIYIYIVHLTSPLNNYIGITVITNIWLSIAVLNLI